LSLGGAIGGLEFVKRADIVNAASAVGKFLATPSTFDLFSYDRFMFLMVFIFICIVIFESIINRNRPFTILSTELRFEFLDAVGKDLLISRVQYLYANQPDLTAYYMETWTDFGGTIPKDRVIANARAGNVPIPNHVDIPPTVSTGRLELTHVFDNKMPFTVWNMLIPHLFCAQSSRVNDYSYRLSFVVNYRTII
jgi:hypothetical protein